MSKLLIVIPAYNEEANIVKVVNGIVKNYPQYDYVVVNDGSRDKTAAICREHGFRLIDLPVNLGLAGAFQTGLRYAAENGYDCAMQLDADGQHRPEYIAAMLEELESGADIVIGSRFLTVKKPKSLRMLGSYIISWSIRLTTGRAICDPTSGMRLFNRAMVEEFAQNLNYGPEPDTISYLIKNGAVVRITISDKGVGIPDVAKAMEPMYTTGNPDERAGLGFAVMQSFMDRVHVSSAPGRGTRVTMSRHLDSR